MLLRGKLSETAGYQISLLDGPPSVHHFCTRVHVNVFFLDWCIFLCRVTKQGAHKYECGICSAWKCCAKDGQYTYSLHLLGGTLCQ